MRGIEYTYPLALGDFLQDHGDGTYSTLRGKYQGALTNAPTGYIRNFVLKKWDLTDQERRVLTRYSVKDKEK
jgi:hypothetical protein